MAPLDLKRAWKDKADRLSLSAEQRVQLPAHPAVSRARQCIIST